MKYYMNEMRWPEFAARKDDIIILPVGSTEQHAQHLPLSTDAVIAEKFALALAKEVNGIVMPTMSVIAPEPYTVMIGSAYTLPGFVMNVLDVVTTISDTFCACQKGLQRKLTTNERCGFPRRIFSKSI